LQRILESPSASQLFLNLSGPMVMIEYAEIYHFKGSQTILAFEMLTVLVIVVVEWDHHVKLGILEPVAAETLNCLEYKFACVQVCLAATIDFGAYMIGSDGLSSLISSVIDSGFHLAGGFAMYNWFGEGDAN